MDSQLLMGPVKLLSCDLHCTMQGPLPPILPLYPFMAQELHWATPLRLAPLDKGWLVLPLPSPADVPWTIWIKLFFSPHLSIQWFECLFSGPLQSGVLYWTTSKIYNCLQERQDRHPWRSFPTSPALAIQRVLRESLACCCSHRVVQTYCCHQSCTSATSILMSWRPWMDGITQAVQPLFPDKHQVLFPEPPSPGFLLPWMPQRGVSSQSVPACCSPLSELGQERMISVSVQQACQMVTSQLGTKYPF